MPRCPLCGDGMSKEKTMPEMSKAERENLERLIRERDKGLEWALGDVSEGIMLRGDGDAGTDKPGTRACVELEK
jgi:hypothetical protein